MTAAAAWRRDWRQLRLLSRASVRRLLDAVVISRESDPAQFAVWATALAIAPPLLFAVRKTIDYPILMSVRGDVLEQILIIDRLFFVVYGMLASALLAALTWEVLFADRIDQEIVGALPVKPLVLAAARLGAAVAVSVVFAAAINLPSAAVYTLGSSAHPLAGTIPRLLAGHLAATGLACAFMFLALIALRGVVSICAGERAANRLAIVLQFLTIVLLVEVFLFLPSVLPALIREMLAGDSWLTLLPPVWFAALFASIADSAGALSRYASLGVIATAMAAAAAAAVSLGPAAWMGRRALHVRSRGRARLVMHAARAIAMVFARPPAVRGMFLFGVASLTRSRRHALVLASYLGMAIAAAIVSVINAELRGRLRIAQPEAYLLAIPLVFLFFAVFGLRGAFAIPTGIDANWPFRLAPPTVTASLRASRLLMLSVGIVPIVAIWLIVTLAVWPAGIAWRATALDLVAGLLVMEVALIGWTKVPFATAHEPATETLKSRWMWYLLFLLIYARGGAAIEFDAIQSTRATVPYLLAGVMAIALLRTWRGRQGRRQSPTLDAVPRGVETLNLSGALN